MFDFPNLNTPPPRTERQPDMSDLFADLAKKMVERLEQDAPDEKIRLSAGVTLRVAEVKNRLDDIFKYATEHREKVSAETIQAARDLLDSILSEIGAFLEANPVPAEAKPEN